MMKVSLKMMNCSLKMTNSVLNMMNVVLQMMNLDRLRGSSRAFVGVSKTDEFCIENEELCKK